MKKFKYILPALGLVGCFATATLTSCDDMLNLGNDDILYADKNHLTTANDTVNSYVGILVQLQKIAIRTNLFGELRGDLVDVTSNANANLKAIADFTVDDDNTYNNPRDYYAVINNCNYYLANADTALRESRYENGARSDFYVFRAEYVAVRAVRAWLYLQLGQIYGANIPLVTEPILSLDDADNALANAPKKNLSGLCDYFIDDLKPYVSWFNYFTHSSGYNSHMPARMSVFPVSLVLGDLYLWSSSLKRDPQLAREAAKCYFDYIDWTPGGKNSNSGYKHKTVVKNISVNWPVSSLSSGNFAMAPNGSDNAWFNTSSFGTDNSEVITAIGMDSASAEGHFNELRYLYCYNRDESNVEASFKPSKACSNYSDSQVYYDYYVSNGTVNYTTVGNSQLTEDQVNGHVVGDLRLGTTYSIQQRQDMMQQMINKAYYPQDVIIYRAGDVYLRLAEALNYAGFPKFALAILTIGLDNNVINGLVLPECINAQDSAFVQYFDFNVNFYRTRATGYAYGNISLDMGRDQSAPANLNQIGLHQRGCGWAYDNPYYYPAETDIPSDMTGYPEEPLYFDTSYKNNASMKAEVYLDSLLAKNQEFVDQMIAAKGEGYELPNLEAYANNLERLDAITAYEELLQAYALELSLDYINAVQEWYKQYGYPQVHTRQIEVVDSLIDVESALETCFEGFRFGYLMRDAERKGDPTVLANKVAKRDESLRGKLSSKNNWFIRWNGQIGQ